MRTRNSNNNDNNSSYSTEDSDNDLLKSNDFDFLYGTIKQDHTFYNIEEKCPIFALPPPPFSVCLNGSELGEIPPPLKVAS